MARSGNNPGRFEGWAGRDHGALARWERLETRRRLRALSTEESCAELAKLFATFGTRPPEDLMPLLERDERERLELVARRQRAFRGISAAAASGRADAP